MARPGGTTRVVFVAETRAGVAHRRQRRSRASRPDTPLAKPTSFGLERCVDAQIASAPPNHRHKRPLLHHPIVHSHAPDRQIAVAQRKRDGGLRPRGQYGGLVETFELLGGRLDPRGGWKPEVQLRDVGTSERACVRNVDRHAACSGPKIAVAEARV